MNPKEQLIRYRMEKARNCLEAAMLLLKQQNVDSAVNRAYYSIFHEVTALLLTRNITSRKHSGIMSFFNQFFVKTGVIDKEFSKFYSTMYESRQDSDYGDFVKFDLDIVKKWIHKTEAFLDELDKVIEEEMKNGE
ncbi:MAG: HEPN domain-containing protein [Candidatus Eremiobacteraeota bacterium]|nr:HEPN domain-containing protein [Candidatus Eremiobacteraeota bacterium]